MDPWYILPVTAGRVWTRPTHACLLILTVRYAFTVHVSRRQVNRCKGGVCEEELRDTYESVERDMDAMKEDGTVIAVLNKETNK